MRDFMDIIQYFCVFMLPGRGLLYCSCRARFPFGRTNPSIFFSNVLTMGLIIRRKFIKYSINDFPVR